MRQRGGAPRIAPFRNALAAVGGPSLTDAEIQAGFGPSEDGMFQRLVPARWEEAFTAAGVLPIAAAWAPTAVAQQLQAVKPHALFTDAAAFHTWLRAS
jgi:hypothetical protein